MFHILTRNINFEIGLYRELSVLRNEILWVMFIT